MHQSKVLIVDDDSFFRALVEKLLSSAGYEVIEARSAHEGEQALWRRPDLAIIDYRMQGADGVSLIRKIREGGLSIPIIFCSGSGYSAQTLSCLRNVLKVELVLPKPIEPGNFLKQVAALLPKPAVPEESCSIPSFASVYNPGSKTDGSSLAALPGYESLAGLKGYETDVYGGNGNNREQQITPENEVSPDYQVRPENEVSPEYQVVPENEVSPECEVIQEREVISEADSCADIASLIEQVRQEYISELRLSWPGLKTRIFDLAESYSNGELRDSVLAALHTIKGTSGSVGLSDLSLTAAELERLMSSYRGGGEGRDFDKLVSHLGIFEYWLSEPGEVAPPRIVQAGPAIAEPPQSLTCEPSLCARMLLVGCDSEAIAALSGYLSAHPGIEARSLSEPLKVLLELESFHPDLIFLDEEVGDISVLDLIELIRSMAHWHAIPIIVSISNTDFEFRNALYQAGATDFITKPFLEQEVQYRLGSAIRYRAPKTVESHVPVV